MPARNRAGGDAGVPPARERAPGGAPRARPVAGILLAAGASRRMEGSNKLLLPVEDEPMVRRAARTALAAGLSPLVVVLGHEPDAVREVLAELDCDFATNPDYTGPTSGSLHAGLRALPAGVEAAVVMLADMVHLREHMLRTLIAAGDDTGAPLAVSRYGDVTAPPLLFRRALFDELLAWTGEGCGKAVVQRHKADAAYVDWPAAALADVDTPADYAALSTTPRGR